MSPVLWVDHESYSETPIKNGTYVYCENARVDIASYAFDDGPIQLIDFTLGRPGDRTMYADMLHEVPQIRAHNAQFDRNLLRLGNLKIEVPIKKWRCSMVKALLHGLPGGLDKLCGILNVPQDLAKMKEGHALMMLFCKPQGKNRKVRIADRTTHPVEWAQYLEYAKHDISAMREVWKRLPSWNYSEEKGGALERDLWHLDQEINDRGVLIDLPLVRAAIRATDDEQARLKERTQVLTGFDAETGEGLESSTQRDKMLEFILEDYGVGLADLTKATVKKLLEEEDLPPGLAELLRLRQQASTSSTAKYNAFARGCNTDSYLRGMLQFSGAARTRRSSGRTVQLQNLPSRELLPQKEIEFGIQAMMAQAEDLVFDDVMKLTASAIRSVIIAPKGRKLVVADLANIEGRDLAWLAGESWKLQAFRDYDTFLLDEHGQKIFDGKDDFERMGPDLYKLAYAKAFGISPRDVSKTQRAIGKVLELFMGYQGGLGAFLTGALGYSIDLEAMADIAWDTLPADTVAEAEDFLEWMAQQKRTFPLSHKAAVTCEVFKRLWRNAHPMTVKLWDEVQSGFVKATQNPSTTYTYRGLKFRRDGAWLRIQLPSGRCLCYPHPEIDGKQCSYMGVHQFSRKWCRIKTYGGRLVENICQSNSRDVLFDIMPKVEQWRPIMGSWLDEDGDEYEAPVMGEGLDSEGYRICLTVHDELITTAPDTDEYSSDGLARLMSINPDWATGLPLAAAGFESPRYRK